jgi:hypothetical protein
LTWLIIVSSCMLCVTITVSKTISLRPVFECPLFILHAVPIAPCIRLWVCCVWGNVGSQIIELSIVHPSASFIFFMLSPYVPRAPFYQTPCILRLLWSPSSTVICILKLWSYFGSLCLVVRFIRRFGGTCCSHLRYVLPKRRRKQPSLHV